MDGLWVLYIASDGYLRLFVGGGGSWSFCWVVVVARSGGGYGCYC